MRWKFITDFSYQTFLSDSNKRGLTRFALSIDTDTFTFTFLSFFFFFFFFNERIEVSGELTAYIIPFQRFFQNRGGGKRIRRTLETCTLGSFYKLEYRRVSLPAINTRDVRLKWFPSLHMETFQSVVRIVRICRQRIWRNPRIRDIHPEDRCFARPRNIIPTHGIINVDFKLSVSITDRQFISTRGRIRITVYD